MMHGAGTAPPPLVGFVGGGIPPQHHGMGVVGMQRTTPVVVTTVAPLGNRPIYMVCHQCRAEIRTSTESRPGLIAWISGAFLAMIGCFWGCCLIPCCLEECMDTKHTCPNCKCFIGNYRR